MSKAEQIMHIIELKQQKEKYEKEIAEIKKQVRKQVCEQIRKELKEITFNNNEDEFGFEFDYIVPEDLRHILDQIEKGDNNE